MDDEDKYTRITLRIPKDLHVRVSEAADAVARSTNAEIVARLLLSFEAEAKLLELTDENNELAFRLQHAEAPIQELKHQLAAKETELATLREVGRAMERALSMSEGVTESLAHYLVALHASLPAKVQKEHGAQATIRLARAVLSKDPSELTGAFIDLFADDAREVAELKRLRNELVHAQPGKKRS